jgi:hypothetical protein
VLWDRIFEALPVEFQRILGIKLLAEMHSTITTAIVALTVRVVLAFVCMCAAALGFAFSVAARQCYCMLRCLDFWAAGKGGRSRDITIFGRSRMLSSLQQCLRHDTAVQKLDLDCTEADKIRYHIFGQRSGKATAKDVLNSL